MQQLLTNRTGRVSCFEYGDRTSAGGFFMSVRAWGQDGEPSCQGREMQVQASQLASETASPGRATRKKRQPDRSRGAYNKSKYQTDNRC